MLRSRRVRCVKSARYLRRDEKELLAILEENKKTARLRGNRNRRGCGIGRLSLRWKPIKSIYRRLPTSAAAAQLRRMDQWASTFARLLRRDWPQTTADPERPGLRDRRRVWTVRILGKTLGVFPSRSAAVANKWKWTPSGGGCELLVKVTDVPATQFT